MKEELGKKISVCLLTYNHAHLIESTVASILDQTLSGFEVIISDDCSTDGTWEKLQSLAARDLRIKPVRTPRNLGMAGNANFAVGQSDRPYIALLHHDDLYRKDLLEEWVSVLERCTEAAFVFNPYGVHRSDYIYQEPMLGECIDGKWMLKRYLFPQWHCLIRGTAMIRRSAWDQVGGIREKFGLLADIDLWMRLARQWQVGYVDEPVIIVRQDRPEDYPDEYNNLSGFWRRLKCLYDIHASNRLEYWNIWSPLGRIKWWGFRFRVSMETIKWLVYAVVRKKMVLIATADQGATPYEYWPAPVLRKMIQYYWH